MSSLHRNLTSLACLVEPAAFTAILRRYVTDKNKPRPFAHNLAWTLISLARRWVRLDPASLGELDELRKCLGNQPKRLTEKNRTLLHTLDDPAVRAKLFVFPERLANWADDAPPVRGAIAMEIAVAVAHPSVRSTPDQKSCRAASRPASDTARGAAIPVAGRHTS
jgi:hypothetical protein